jgi:ABC-type transport system involved in multi-copper enzyme maturation permease subunit
MKNNVTAIIVEWIKIRRSRILWTTFLLFMFIPFMMGLLVFVARNPETAAKLGLIGTKAKMFGENDWTGYCALLLQVVASIGLFAFGFVSAWVFAREHTDHTLKDLLALPVPRSAFVAAKTLMVFAWCMALSVVFYTLSLSAGFLLHLPGGSSRLLWQFTRSFFMTSLLTTFLCPPISWLAGYSRGIVAPLGLVFLTLIMAQFAGLVGLGPYFPWAIPGLYSVASHLAGLQLNWVSFLILAFTTLAGYLATLHWWRHADHH